MQIEELQYDVELKARDYTQILHWGMAFFRKLQDGSALRMHA